MLQQIHLRVFRRSLGETNPNADETDGFPSASKCFTEQGAEIL
jgi:hypothetical protein